MAAQDPRNLYPVGRYPIFMLNNPLVLIIVGTVLGFLSGLGVGGGSLLMLWLTLVTGLSHTDARFINLLFFIPCAVVASFFRWKQGAVDLKQILPAVIAGCISAGIFSAISGRLDAGLLKKMFGILLLFTAIRELFYRPRKAR